MAVGPRRIPAARPWIKAVQMLAALALSVPLLVAVFVLSEQWPVGGVIGIVTFVAFDLAVIVLIITLFRVIAVRYWRLSLVQAHDLKGRTLCHYTSLHSAAKIMGVSAIPLGGLTGPAELLTGKSGRLTFITKVTGGRAGVFVWSGPLANPCRFVRPCEAVVEISGSALTDPHLVDWHLDGALRIRGGYRGLATARPV